MGVFELETKIRYPLPMTNPFDSQIQFPYAKKVLAVASGKGGVGKSTISSHIAFGLQRRGLRVGILDADVYGPSLPRMFGCLKQKPEVTADQKMIPVDGNGVSVMSMGFLLDEDSAVVWRGPMLFKAIQQFLFDVAWGELDVLVIDMPPGTGDVPLTFAQKIKIDGVVVVTTPQNVALSDVKKSVDMFKRIGIPILGLVENMAWLEGSTQSGERVELFPRGDLDAFCKTHGLQQMAQIPFQTQLAKSAEMGLSLFDTGSGTETSQKLTLLCNQLAVKLGLDHVDSSDDKNLLKI